MRLFSSLRVAAVRNFSASATLFASKPTVGFIGLGNMGGPMARNVHKNGFPLVVFDVHAPSVESFRSLPNVQAAATPAEVASRSEIVVTMLPSSPHVRAVFDTPATGLLAGLAPSKPAPLFIDASTIDPGAAREVAALVRKAGADLLDAPVSGGVGGAAAGTLTFMVGGEAAALERAQDVLRSMGKNIVHCGPAGAGQIVKVCNNLVLGISMIGVSEAMNLGVSLGADAKTMAAIFNTSSARCWSSDTYNPVPGVMPNVPASRDYTGGFAVDLIAKDLGLANDAAKSASVPLPLGSLALRVYQALSQHGWGKRDFSSVYAALKEKIAELKDKSK